MVNRSPLAAALGFMAAAYLIGLLGWLAIWQLVGDRSGWLFALNALALYLFLPLPLVAPIALFARKRALWLGFALAVAVWAYLWGPLFLQRPQEPLPGEQVLRVMTYNVLGFNLDTESVLSAIREADADVIGFKELNPTIAQAIRDRLGDEYPYQKLDAQPGVTGSGIISRYPFTPTGETLADPEWVGPPDVVEVAVAGTSVTLVRFHSVSKPANFAARERQARLLADFAAAQEGPLILLGDLNASSTNNAYAIITDVLEDAWRGAGRGFGHTFPGVSKAINPGSGRPQILGISLPSWLLRIDYVFHSEHWRPVSARTGSYGSSDHRPLIVDLALKEP
jgi:vancomycin resistance protein VanJ